MEKEFIYQLVDGFGNVYIDSYFLDALKGYKTQNYQDKELTITKIEL